MYPSDTKSLVEVIFRETGEVKVYPVSASPGISRYLADQIAATGCLCLLCGDETHTILAERIQEYSIRAYVPETSEQPEEEQNDDQ